MAIDLLSIQPHKVSRDLSGYITFIYGPAKVGKTTFGSHMPGHLILAFERGYNALPGVMVMDVTSWGEMKQIVRELKKPEVKEVYKSIIIDTVDVAADSCQKYVISLALKILVMAVGVPMVGLNIKKNLKIRSAL